LVNTVLPQAVTELRRDPGGGSDPARAAAVAATLAEHTGHLRPGLADSVRELKRTDAVAPIVSYLIGPACTISGETFAAGCGRFARVFLGETHGWAAGPSQEIGPQDVADHLGEIMNAAEFIVPDSVYHEIEYMARIIRAWDGPGGGDRNG
jgi:hypothetical protein